MSVEYRSLDLILGFPGYRVGDDGSIWSMRRGRWKKRALNPVKGKYLRLQFYGPGIVRHFYVNVIVLLAFRGPKPDGCETRHFPDRDVRNNRLENLQWGTLQQNAADKLVHGTHTRGVQNANAKLTMKQVARIHELKATTSRRDLSRKFNVSRTTISRIVRNESYQP